MGLLIQVHFLMILTFETIDGWYRRIVGMRRSEVGTSLLVFDLRVRYSNETMVEFGGLAESSSGHRIRGMESTAHSGPDVFAEKRRGADRRLLSYVFDQL